MESGEAASQNVQDILDHSACGARHDADPLRELGRAVFYAADRTSRALAVALSVDGTSIELSDSQKLQFPDDDLVLAAGSIEADLPFGNHLISLFGHAGKRSGVPFKEDRGNLRAGVFQAEIEMARRLELEIADFPCTEMRAKIRLEDRFNSRR